MRKYFFYFFFCADIQRGIIRDTLFHRVYDTLYKKQVHSKLDVWPVFFCKGIHSPRDGECISVGLNVGHTFVLFHKSEPNWWEQLLQSFACGNFLVIVRSKGQYFSDFDDLIVYPDKCPVQYPKHWYMLWHRKTIVGYILGKWLLYFAVHFCYSRIGHSINVCKILINYDSSAMFIVRDEEDR